MKSASHSVLLVAYTPGKVWSEARLTAHVVLRAMSGRYGFTPTEIFVNDHPRGRPVVEYRAKLLQRIDSGSVELLDATTGGQDTLPAFGVSVSSSSAACITKVRLPYIPEEAGPEVVQGVLEVAKELITDTKAEFLRGHDFTDWTRLHRERRGRRIFVPSQIDGAYWLTYLCREYVARLGGEQELLAAPLISCSHVSDGLLLQSHNSFAGLGNEPQKSALDELHSFLANLVKPEDRP